MGKRGVTPNRPGAAAGRAPDPLPATFVTAQQAVVHALFVKHRSMSTVARLLGISQIRVREALVQHERNRMRDAGLTPPSLKEMLQGDVAARFGVSKQESGGRPAMHPRAEAHAATDLPKGGCRSVPLAGSGVRRLLVTSVEAGRDLHRGFWDNLCRYAAAVDAELVVLRCGAGRERYRVPSECETFIAELPIVADGAFEIAAGERLAGGLARPLDQISRRDTAGWTVVPAPAIQLETLPRLRADGLRIQLTTGAATIPSEGARCGRREAGAVIVELTAGGVAHCRHLLADLGGDGSFQDLDAEIDREGVRRRRRVEAITFGDIHEAHLDAAIAAATWGDGLVSGGSSLMDRLRPRFAVFHDVCDFDARNPHDRTDHLKRFAQLANGGGDVRAELAAAAAFLAATRRAGTKSVVVGSNHDEMFLRWLRHADFREDPLNAEFFLEASLDLHRRIAAGGAVDGFFEATLRRLSSDGLAGVRFLRCEESLRIAGVEAGIHGHLGADGRRGDARFFERLGIRATLGHTHRPSTRDGICCAGVSASGMRYARGLLTAWAPGHVVTYASGARQHLVLVGGAFHA